MTDAHDATQCERSVLERMENMRQSLAQLTLSCRDVQPHTAITTTTAPVTDAEETRVALLQLQIEQLQSRLVAAVSRRERDDAVFQRAMAYAAAKGTANGVLHALFDQASAGKHAVLAAWVQTGVIPTRDGLRHWRVDLREVRNEVGASVLHVAVDASLAREPLKVKLVALLVDRVGFDVDIQDAFGRTPLHVAALAGLVEVVRALLDRGADPQSVDRSGSTPLSVVRTLSRPKEEVVQALAAAEQERSKQFHAASNQIATKHAVASALFLGSMARFVVSPQARAAFTVQCSALLTALQERLRLQRQDSQVEMVAFDAVLRLHTPILFAVQHAASSSMVSPLAPLESLFTAKMYTDREWLDALRVELAGFDLSLAPSATATMALAGATWVGWLLKLIHAVRNPVDTLSNHLEQGREEARKQCGRSMDDDSMSESATDDLASSVASDESREDSRQAWHYAVLMRAASHALPGDLHVTAGSDVVVCSEDVARFFPLTDRLLIAGEEYHGVAYDRESRELRLDREYEGTSTEGVRAFLAGSGEAQPPPYITAKRLWEREPGNKYEDHQSQEQELFQDYQWLDPESAYEVAVKLGPVPSAREARELVREWKTRTRALFTARECASGSKACVMSCPQRNGQSLCVGTMVAIGRDLAKKRLGRPTFSKQLKSRASLQKYQQRFKGTLQAWPGSPSSCSPWFFSPSTSEGQIPTSTQGNPVDEP